jgi:hypothetical protein
MRSCVEIQDVYCNILCEANNLFRSIYVPRFNITKQQSHLSSEYTAKQQRRCRCRPPPLFGGFANVASKAQRALTGFFAQLVGEFPKPPAKIPNGILSPIKPSRCSVYTAKLRLRKRKRTAITEKI